MLNKGSFSFVAMLVINPIVILFYQNCSMAPISHAQNSTPPSVQRQIASEPIKKVSLAKVCDCEKQHCPQAE